MLIAAHSVRGRLVASRPVQLLPTLSRREEPSRQGKHVAVPSAIAGVCSHSDCSMARAIGWAAQVLSPGGGIEVARPIEPAGFYWAGFLCLFLGALKLTVEKHWTWWRVFLPVLSVLAACGESRPGAEDFPGVRNV